MIKYQLIKIDNNLSRPYLNVTLINPENNKNVRITALIDTGADECCFPIDMAYLLGHDFKNGRLKRISTANGDIEVFSHTNRIFIKNYMTKDILIDFSDKLKIPILGVRNFLSDFILTINYPEKYFTLEKIS